MTATAGADDDVDATGDGACRVSDDDGCRVSARLYGVCRVYVCTMVSGLCGRAGM